MLTNVGRDHTDGGGRWRGGSPRRRRASSSRAPLRAGRDGCRPARHLRREPARRRTGARLDFGCDGNRLAVGGRVVDLRTPGGTLRRVFLPVHGAHRRQRRRRRGRGRGVLRASLDADVVRRGVRRAAQPGRFEVVRRDPLVVLDGAHNPDGARAVVETLADGFIVTADAVVVGMLEGRDPSRCSTSSTRRRPGGRRAARPTPRALPAADARRARPGVGRGGRRSCPIGRRRRPPPSPPPMPTTSCSSRLAVPVGRRSARAAPPPRVTRPLTDGVGARYAA